ncbi:hypothetical protein [Streptomyces chrestomyceticus]|uniref:hypothetical protein n=1 Tax=Streptomyces chrestomyceticus TaxID=68185 RepID=UPI0019D14EF9|nr:hypothetical protein [Streptomyces chrestomyceticus]
MRRHFDEPWIKDAVLVTVLRDTEGAEPVHLTAAETYEVLYGPGSDPQFAAAVWKEVLRSALSDLTPHGTGKLLVIWLVLPRLTGTVHRICMRLRADRSDVEAEMVLALLEHLADPDAASRLSASSLAHAARARAWHFARNGLREFPSTRVEHLPQDHALTSSDREADAPTEKGLDIRVDRPDGPDGLHAPLRFRVHPEHLRKDAFTDTDDETKDRPAHYRPWKKRRFRRHAGTRPARPARRRA